MPTKPRPPVVNVHDLPVVLKIADMAAIYRVSERTIRRQLEAGAFRPLPREKYPYRWYRDDVARDLAQGPSKKLPRRPHGVLKARQADQDAAGATK